jgi:hypothetical protein
VWKPWWLHQSPGKWRPKTEGLHVDQNPLRKTDFACVQGMVPLYAVTEEVGGLEVVPRSHLPAAKGPLIERCGEELRSLGDFCRLPPDYYAEREGEGPVLVVAEPGDLILWDSRTVHGGKVGPGGAGKEGCEEACELARMSLPVCMTPRALASPDVLRARQSMFQQGQTTNHWPHEPRVQNQVSLGYQPISLAPHQLALL